MQIVDARVSVTGPSGSQAAGTIVIHHYEPKDRFWLAIKSFSLWITAAIISFFIPLAHFILVPVFLLAALFFPALAHSRKQRIAGGEALCPDCGQVFVVARGNWQLPISDLCNHCGRPVKISAA